MATDWQRQLGGQCEHELRLPQWRFRRRAKTAVTASDTIVQVLNEIG